MTIQDMPCPQCGIGLKPNIVHEIGSRVHANGDCQLNGFYKTVTDWNIRVEQWSGRKFRVQIVRTSIRREETFVEISASDITIAKVVAEFCTSKYPSGYKWHTKDEEVVGLITDMIAPM